MKQDIVLYVKGYRPYVRGKAEIKQVTGKTIVHIEIPFSFVQSAEEFVAALQPEKGEKP